MRPDNIAPDTVAPEFIAPPRNEDSKAHNVLLRMPVRVRGSQRRMSGCTSLNLELGWHPASPGDRPVSIFHNNNT